MKTPNICPRCKSTIPLSHVFAHSLICAKCGWSASAVREYFIEEQSNTAINAMYGITVVFFILFFGMTTLGISNLQMIPLKISQWTGRASYYELKKIISICHKENNIKCAIGAYEDIVNDFEDTHQDQLELSALLLKQKHFAQAINVLSKYVKNNKYDFPAHYQLAKAYENIQEYKNAEKHYIYILRANSSGLNVAPLRSYVEMLITNKKYQKAKKLIIDIRKKVGHPDLLKKQYDELTQVTTKNNLIAKRK